MSNQVTICLLLEGRNIDTAKLTIGQGQANATRIAAICFINFVLVAGRNIGRVNHQTIDSQFGQLSLDPIAKFSTFVGTVIGCVDSGEVDPGVPGDVNPLRVNEKQ